MVLTAPKGNEKGHGPGASLSWDRFGNPIEGEANQLRLFHQLFGGSEFSVDGRRNQIRGRRNVLDAVRTDAKRLSRGLGQDDREKVDQYF